MSNQPRKLAYENEAREKLQTGVDKVARAVVTTLGPRGRNVALDTVWGEVRVIHDGVSVAEEIFLKDKFENMGAQLVKQAARKTNDQAGDGTTTATLIAQQITQKGNKARKEGVNPMFMKRGIDSAVKVVIEELKKLAKPVKKGDWENVATISAQNPDIGKKIAEALKIVGEDGLVTADDGATPEVVLEHTEGMELEEGYLSPYFMTNDVEEAELENPYILITDLNISNAQQLLPITKKAKDTGRPILVIGGKVDGEALQMLVINKLKGIFKTCAIKAPSFAEQRTAILEDIAILTGGQVISHDTGIRLEEAELEHCGICKKVIVDKNTTKIIGGDGTDEAIKSRVKQIKKQEGLETNEFKKTQLNERIAKLSKGVVSVRVGAATDVELKEVKERVKDAIGATKAAIEEGIVPGGGVALLRTRKALKKLVKEQASEDERTGVKIVLGALEEPIKWLAKNSGADPEDVIKKVSEQDNPNYGFNASTLEFGDMIKEGVIDPVKVTRLALENGASVASMILTTEALITMEDEDDRQKEVPNNQQNN